MDSSDGGCDCQPQCKQGRAWKGQHPAIKIEAGDAISDRGDEIWNLLAARGIKNVIVMGVHTNMCVLGRPFGLRNLARYGKHAVLVRNLTDTMYNPRKAPFVSHARGTALVIEHTEKYVCPSILSDDLLGQTRQPHVVFIIGEPEYALKTTLPAWFKEQLEPLGMRCSIFHADEKDGNDFPGLDQAKDADLLVVATRRRTPPTAQMAFVRHHLEEGRPLIGLRTASHAFAAKPPDDQHVAWDHFDVEVLGGHYENHYKAEEGPTTKVELADKAAAHPILRGLPGGLWSVTSTLYRSRNLAESARPLLIGRLEGKDIRETVAWTNTYKGGRIFYTSLGSEDEFKNPAFRRLLTNAALWAMEMDVARGR